MNSNSIQNLINRISPEQLQRYLNSVGWRRVDTLPGRCSIYHFPDDDTSEVVVPLNVAFRDYNRRILEAVKDLAERRSTSNDVILREILTPLLDRISYQVTGFATRNHQIGLSEGVSVYQSAMETFKAAAHDQVFSKRFHPRLARKEAIRYIQACRLGVPEEGSFVTNIFCPADLEALDAQNAESVLFSDPVSSLDRNFARLVTARTLHSMYRAVQAVERNQIDILVPLENEEQEDVISSNYFEALSKIKVEDTSADIVVSVDWTPLIPAPEGVPMRIVLKPEYSAFFHEIALRLRPSSAPRTEQIKGRVTVLSGEPGDLDLMQGEVIIEGETSEGTLVKVRVELTEDHYQLACDAHKFAQKVHIAGTLKHGDRLQHLTTYFGFYVDQVPTTVNNILSFGG